MPSRRRIHPLVAALIAYPLAAWLTMAVMFFASRSGAWADDDANAHRGGGGAPDRTELIIFAASPIVLPLLLVLGVLSNGAHNEHRQVLEYGLCLLLAWTAFAVILCFLPLRRRQADRGTM